jgi:hypothetical protein
VLGLIASLVALGILDWLTWAQPFHSAIQYARFAVEEGGLSAYGREPTTFYASRIAQRLGLGAILLAVPMLAAIRRDWRLIMAWLLPLAAFGLIPHKEERFILSVWPFVLASALSGALHLSERRGRDAGNTAGAGGQNRELLGRSAPILALLVGACLAAGAGVAKLPLTFGANVLAAQQFIGQRSDATGALIENAIWWSKHEFPWESGGHFVLNRNIPMLSYRRELLDHGLFNYVAVSRHEHLADLDRRRDFTAVAEFGGTTVYRRIGDDAGIAAVRTR